jgi:hypothetical protein
MSVPMTSDTRSPVECEQGYQCMLGSRPESGGDQEAPSSLRSRAVACDS